MCPWTQRWVLMKKGSLLPFKSSSSGQLRFELPEQESYPFDSTAPSRQQVISKCCMNKWVHKWIHEHSCFGSWKKTFGLRSDSLARMVASACAFMDHFPLLLKDIESGKSTFYRHTDEADRGKITASETNFRGFWNKLSLHGESLYFLHRSHSPSPPRQVPGRCSNPTLLCAEAKAPFPASKGPLFGLSLQISVSWAWPSCFWELWCLASRFVVLTAFKNLNVRACL